MLVESLAWIGINYRQVFSYSDGDLAVQLGYIPDPELLAKPKPHYASKIEFCGNIGEVLCLPPHPAEPFELKYDKNVFRNDDRLLRTVFPTSLAVIEEELRATGHWEGKLVHERRDGSKITVTSHWDLQQNPRSQDRSATVIEINGLLPASSLRSFRNELL